MSGVIILNCRVCGAEVEVNEQRCSKCKEIENNVQVLTLEEKQHFSGITLEQDQQQEEGHYQEPGSYANQQMYTKQFTISNTSLLTKLLLGIILAGLLFVALPIAIVVISLVGIITYIVGR